MTYRPGLKLVLGCLWVLAIIAAPASAAASYGPPVATPQSGAAVTASGEVLSLSAPDHGWHAAEAARTDTNKPDPSLDKAILALATDNETDAADANDVVRHRGFRKALLIILICGALIRLLTSPSYKKFIADVLDPKAF